MLPKQSENNKEVHMMCRIFFKNIIIVAILQRGPESPSLDCMEILA
jgi:hypothetical protein